MFKGKRRLVQLAKQQEKPSSTCGTHQGREPGKLSLTIGTLETIDGNPAVRLSQNLANTQLACATEGAQRHGYRCSKRAGKRELELHCSNTENEGKPKGTIQAKREIASEANIFEGHPCS